MWLLIACVPVERQDSCVPEGETNPYIALISPEDGAVVCGTPLAIDVCVGNIELVEPLPEEDTGADTDPGTGHVDIMLNGQDATMTGETHAEIAQVDDGEWQVKAELSNTDHTPVDPYAGDFAYITVSAAECE